MKILILAGGRGSRLHSVVSDRPKPLADIAGQPFLSYQLDYLISQGVSEVYLSIGYMGDQIKNFYGETYRSLKIFYIQEENLLGTGGAIKYALSLIKPNDSELCLVLNGDTFFNLNLKKFEHFFTHTKTDIAIGLAHVPDTGRYGRVDLDLNNHEILNLGEKDKPGPGWINAGVYLFSSAVMRTLSQMEETIFSWETEILAKAAEKNLKRFGFCQENSHFIDIGVPEDYERAQTALPEWISSLSPKKNKKIAIVADWLVTVGGAEIFLSHLLDIFPEADLFAVIDFLTPEDRQTIVKGKFAKTTFIQRLPWAKTQYRAYLPLMPLAIEQLDLSGYDLIISSSHAVAKGVITGPDQIHVAYIHSPMRYAWDLQPQYLKESGLTQGLRGSLVRYLLHKLRAWDVQSSHGVDYFLANSDFIRRRILKVYRREAEVLYGGIDLAKFALGHSSERQDFYLTASRMVPYKKIDLIVEAFSKKFPEKKLVVIGDGPDFEKIKKLVGPNVELLGYQSSKILLKYMQTAKAFVFAAEEDFGRVPVEAQACGTPVIAYGKGGALETVKGLDAEGPTGVFFEEQTIESLVKAVERFENNLEKFKPEVCRENAERFGLDEFKKAIKAFVLKIGRG